VVDLVEIVVSHRQHVPQKDNGGNRCGGGDFSTDVLENEKKTIENTKTVSKE